MCRVILHKDCAIYSTDKIMQNMSNIRIVNDFSTPPVNQVFLTPRGLLYIPIGTPIIAVESGYVEAIGWNQYGGWRIGIRSFDGKRYYYYAHLRQNYPYREQLKEGDVVTAGDVIGYMGHTGYSTKENVNNIDTVHLHFGLQLIFDEAQKEGNNEIWVDCYNLTRFLYKNRSAVQKVGESREWKRTLQMTDPAVVKYQKTVKKQ